MTCLKNRTWQLILTLLFWTTTLTAAPSDTTQTRQPLLWQASSDSTTVYLLGSIHLLPPRAYPLHPAIYATFDTTDIAVFETDISAATDLTFQTQLMQKGLADSGHTLDQTLSPETYAQLRDHLKTMGVGIQQFHNFQPWFVAMTAMTLQLTRLGYQPELGLDTHLYNRLNPDRETRYLETPTEQINLLATLSELNQERFVQYTLAEMDMLQTEMDTLIVAWQHGDAPTIQRIMTQSLGQDPDLQIIYDNLVHQRNNRMTDRIKKYLSSRRTYFVTVGAGHLVGPTGIISQLREAGFPVEQVRSQ